MRRCAFLTLDDPTGYVIDDDLAYSPLAALGWQTALIPWRHRGVEWSTFDAVVIRSTWDYHDQPDAFLAALAAIERTGARLYNGLDLVRWNLQKTYLRDLTARGVPVVPSVWRERLLPGEFRRLLAAVGSEEVVVKPVVGANSAGAFRLGPKTTAAEAAAVEACYQDRPLLAQPFVPTVITEGEYSLFYFDGAYSHAILKIPKTAEFRVQEEHGGLIQSVSADQALRAAGDQAVEAIGAVPLYARVDLVRSSPDGSQFWLMELELIEPALYFRMDERAAERFARALHARVTAATTQGN
jgi:glutathione synthase/RimK-type ligase-like ATP-grasp enzyme